MTAPPTAHSQTPRCRFRLDHHRSLRIEEYQGRVGIHELRNVTRSLSQDALWTAELDTYVDFTRANVALSSCDVLRLALMWREPAYRTRGWMAFVVPDSATFELVRMLGHWAKTIRRTRIFPNRDEAEAWLAKVAGHAAPNFEEEELSAVSGREARIAG